MCLEALQLSQEKWDKWTTHLLRNACPPEPPVRNRGVDASICLIIKLSDGDEVEMAHKARCDWVTTTARRTHRAYKLDVLQLAEGVVTAVIPAQSWALNTPV